MQLANILRPIGKEKIMDIDEFAKKLDGREYGNEISKEEEKQANELGYVVVFGYSDDNVEFRGAIDDEVGCYNGRVMFLDEGGIFENCECKCKYARRAEKKCKTIEAVWCPNDKYLWEYKTNIPHAKFDIVEGDEFYCKGIVFSIKDLQ